MLILTIILTSLLLMYMIEYNRLIKSETNLLSRLKKQKEHNNDLMQQVADLTRRLNE